MTDPIKLTIDSALEVEGREDTAQLTVQGSVSQTEPLQVWQNAAGDPVAQMDAEGQLQVGGEVSAEPAALVEASADITLPSSQPKRGWQSLGTIQGALTDAVTWVLHELSLLGSGGITGLHTALRSRLVVDNSGGADGAEVRAGEFEITADVPLGKAVGVYSALDNEAGGDLAEAIAFQMAPPINQGTLDTLVGLDIPDLTEGTENYAIRTGQGPAHLGDFLELQELAASPGGAADVLRLYPKTDGKLYARSSDGTEHDLFAGSGATGSSLKMAILGW